MSELILRSDSTRWSDYVMLNTKVVQKASSCKPDVSAGVQTNGQGCMHGVRSIRQAISSQILSNSPGSDQSKSSVLLFNTNPQTHAVNVDRVRRRPDGTSAGDDCPQLCHRPASAEARLCFRPCLRTHSWAGASLTSTCPKCLMRPHQEQDTIFL